MSEDFMQVRNISDSDRDIAQVLVNVFQASAHSLGANGVSIQLAIETIVVAVARLVAQDRDISVEDAIDKMSSSFKHAHRDMEEQERATLS